MSLHFEREVARLKQVVLEMCALAEQAVQDATAALCGRNDELAEQVIGNDDRIDMFEVGIEEDCLKVLALHQPVATDLRFVVAMMRLSRDLERIADLAVKIAGRALALNHLLPEDGVVDFSDLARKTQTMFRQSIDALIGLDSKLARQVIDSDDEVDAENRAITARVKEEIQRRPADLESFLHLISVARHYERIADHAVNISEDVLYLLDGHIVRHQRKTEPAEA